MTQLIYVIGAVMLLGILMVPMHRVALDRQSVLISSEALTTATAVGQEMMEEILSRKFDQNTTGTASDASIKTPSVFSLILGPDGGESADTNFNDIDDFNGYTKVVPTPRIGNFYDTVSVMYVDTTAPFAPAIGKTWFKRIDVKVWNPYLPSQGERPTSILVSKIVSFRYKN